MVVLIPESDVKLRGFLIFVNWRVNVSPALMTVLPVVIVKILPLREQPIGAVLPYPKLQTELF